MQKTGYVLILKANNLEILSLFSVLKARYYQLLSYSSLDMSAKALNETSGTAITRIYKNNANIIFRSSSGHSEITNNVFHTTAVVSFLNSGNNLKVQMFMTRPYRISDSSLTTTYFGE